MQASALDAQRQSEPHLTAGPVSIVADDLTGACDSGVAFLSAGRSVRVVLDPTHLDGIPREPETILAVTTETRGVSSAEAAQQVARTLKLLRSESTAPLFFKKIDSAARGNVAAETIAALEASSAALALVAPAFPAAGRTVRNGVLTIRDGANQNTALSLTDLFQGVPDQIGILAAPTANGIADAIASGIRILLCDSQTQADLDRLAAAASRLPQPILWTGSAGLAHALAATLPRTRNTSAVAPSRDGRILLFVGTDHPVTTLQVAHLADTPQAVVHQIDWSAASSRSIQTAFNEAPTAALVLTGGETAAWILRALDASTILLGGELAPGIPWGIVEGGAADGCMVVTKSGGFGARDALLHAFHFCRETCTGRDRASA